MRSAAILVPSSRVPLPRLPRRLSRFSWLLTGCLAVAGLLAIATAAQAQAKVYVLGQVSASTGLPQQYLTVIDAASNTKEARIQLGRGGQLNWSMVIAPDGERIYVANRGDNTVSVVSTATNTVIDTLPQALFGNCISGCGPEILAVSPDGRYLFATGNGLSVIDLVSRTRRNLVSGGGLGLALSPDGSRLYARTAPGAIGPHNIEVFDAAALANGATRSAALIATVTFPVGSDSRGVGLSISANGRFLYAPRSHGVGNYGVAVVDTSTHSFVTETPTPGAYASSARSSPNGEIVYVTGQGSGDVLHRLSPTTHASLGTTSNVGSARDLAFVANSVRAYVAANSAVYVIDTSSHARIGTILFSTATDGQPVSVVARGAFTEPTGPPSAPVALRATVSGNTVSLTWSPPTSGATPTGYTLVARLSAGGPVVAALPMGAATSFRVTAPNGTFVLSVTASNALGTGPESTAVTVTVPQAVEPPAPPSNLTATVSGTTVVFSWSPSSGGGPVANYVLVAGLAPAFAVPYVTMPLGATPGATVPGVPPGTYYVRVLAQNAGGTSAASNEVTVTVAGLEPPAAPTLNAPTVSGSTVTVSWSNGSGGTPATYTLTASTTPGGAPIVSVPLTGTSASFPGVPSGSYYLRLTATNAAGTSPPSAEVSVTVP